MFLLNEEWKKAMAVYIVVSLAVDLGLIVNSCTLIGCLESRHDKGMWTTVRIAKMI